MKLTRAQASKLGVWARRPDQAPLGSGNPVAGVKGELEQMADRILRDEQPLTGRASQTLKREYPWLNRHQLRHRSRHDNCVGDKIETLALQDDYRASLPDEACRFSEELGLEVA